MRAAWLVPFLLLVLMPSALRAADPMSRGEQRAAIEKLPQPYKDWLEEVDVLITDDEKSAFLRLD